jgi:Cytochrome c-type biogenesis protein CcmE
MTTMSENPSATQRPRWRGSLFVVGAITVTVLAFVAITAGGVSKNLVYYWTPTALHAAGEKAYGPTIRLGGMVAPGSIQRSASTVEFDVRDATGVVHVKSSGVPPQMFRENIGVVVEGTMIRGGAFESHRLMVSHNNQYKAPKTGHAVNPEELQKLMKSTKETE